MVGGARARAEGGSSGDPCPRRAPNLLFLFSDQQSHDMLGCYGNEQIVTPNVDRVAGEGVRFNHCVSSCPVCTPYRGMSMIGQHPLYNGCYTNDIALLDGAGPFFGEVLRDAGYCTGYIGKWHIHGGDRNRPIPRGPGRLPAGASSDLLVGTLDLMPTLLGLMGLDAAASVPFFYFNAAWRGVYTREHTYTVEKGKVPSKLAFNVLYDKRRVPQQRENLFDSKAHRPLQEELDRLTREWLDRFEVPFVGRDTLDAVCFGERKGRLSGPGDTGRLPGRPIDLLKGV